jgi:hypothetical protein
MVLLDIQKDTIEFKELMEVFGQRLQVLMRVPQYSQPIREVQMVCDHPQRIINLQHQITDLKLRQFLPLQCDLPELA